MVSSDTVNWSDTYFPFGLYLEDVTFGNNLFVAVGSSGTGDGDGCASIVYSSDGVNWLSAYNCTNPGKETKLNGVAYSNDAKLFVAGLSLAVRLLSFN